MLRDADRDPPGEPQPIGIKALNGDEVWLRPGTADAEVALTTFAGQYHLPPESVGAPKVIWDLGSNIGLTMRHMATVYPEARLLGIELDSDNVQLATRNLEPCADRCELITAALWSRGGEVHYASRAAEDGYHVQEGGDRVVRATTMRELLDVTGRPDYVKMDIEGAEQTVLTEAADWAPAVPAISVECHPPYSLAECRRDLERLGFSVKTYPQSLRRRARDCAVGVRA
jgi:FkbM family methyltransferase